MKRLAQIIVGAGFKTIHPLMPGIAGGEHNHRNVIAFGAPGAQHLKPGFFRQSQVQYHRIVRFDIAENFSITAVAGQVRGKTSFGQIAF